MPVVQINNISVEFPFEPYDVQREYMANIIKSLERGENAILESPSGTGKTLSLLCATSAWLKQSYEEKPSCSFQKAKSFSDFTQRSHGSFRKTKSLNLDECKRPKVIYATRTHSQIQQAMKELKGTAYNDFKATVIASRDQLCIHPKLKGKTNTDKILMCKSKMRKSEYGEISSTCKHYQNFDEIFLKQFPNITDIEDLGSIGNKHGCCPYFLTKKKSSTSDIVFIPYGYLIDPIIREANDIDLKQSIIILDEAHNVNRVCEDSASTSIKDTDISAAIEDLSLFVDDSLYCSGSSGKEERLKRSLQNLREKLQSMQSDTKKGGHLFQLLRSVSITQENFSSTIELLETLITKILTRSSEQEAENNAGQNGRGNASSAPNARGSGLKALLRFLQTISSSPEAKWDCSYRMHIEKMESTHETKLHFWCFDPAIRMNSLLDHDIRCLILTSSTLAPFDTLIAELGVKFPIEFISQHVIEGHQKFAKILSHGFGDELLDSNYRNRKNDNYLLSVGQSIREIGQRVPGGLLVFFPSYAFMEKCMKFWGKDRNEGLWNEIIQQTTICIETQEKEQFTYEIKNYYKTIREKKKATFLAVARGKMSEGLDFSDIFGRAVMVVGIPFAPRNDPKVQQKMLYLDAERIQRDGLPSGSDWYVLDAIRTANQAMGRVIRHKYDYGAMLLCDKKFKESSNKKWISEWIRVRLNTQGPIKFNEIVQELSLFYTNSEQTLPMREPEKNPESFILHEDDEWFATLQTPAEHSEELSDDQATGDETVDETINDSADLSDSIEVSDDQLTIPTGGSENTQKRGLSTVSYDQNSPSNSRALNVAVSVDSDDDSGVKRKRTKKSVKNTIESDVESNHSQNVNGGPLIAFLKAALEGDKYEKLEEIVSKYNHDGTYETLRDVLFKIFDEPKLFYSLKGCVILFKHEQKTDFNKDCEQFIKSSKLKTAIL